MADPTAVGLLPLPNVPSADSRFRLSLTDSQQQTRHLGPPPPPPSWVRNGRRQSMETSTRNKYEVSVLPFGPSFAPVLPLSNLLPASVSKLDESGLSRRCRRSSAIDPSAAEPEIEEQGRRFHVHVGTPAEPTNSRLDEQGRMAGSMSSNLVMHARSMHVRPVKTSNLSLTPST